MRRDVIMPRMGQGMEEGVVVRWLKRPGDRVSRGEHLAEIETDKATVEIESFHDGVLAQIVAEAGRTVPVGGTIAVIEDGQAGEREAKAALAAEAAQAAILAEAARTAEPAPRASTAPAPRAKGPLASPVARRIAAEHGIDLETVVGTGPGGRIGREDVERLMPAASRGAGEPAGADRHAETDGGAARTAGAARGAAERMRRTISDNVTKSKATIPHFYVSIDVDMTDALARRKALDSGGVHVTINDLIVAAIARGAARFPALNSGKSTVDVAVIVAVEGGMVAPVLPACEKRSVVDIARELGALIARVRGGSSTPGDFGDGTIVVSNLGMYGAREFFPIIFPAHTAAVGVGALRTELRETAPGAIAARKIVTLSLSADHRAADGKDAAELLAAVRELIESPDLFA